jgi:starch phosphorylase
MPSWDSEGSDDLWTEVCGKDRWLGTMACLEKNIRKITDEKIWLMRNNSRTVLIQNARERLSRQLIASGASSDEVEYVKHSFNTDTLTLGFARRFATYKRPDLLLRDPQRLINLLSNPSYPVQLIIAGKAHPADQAGQALITKWIQFIRLPQVRPYVMFLSDYDMLLTERLVEGVDVWINTPRRPWEASGTSGMKVLVNGGINLSELDGWWAEAYTPEVGWALGDGQEHGDDTDWDATEAGALYDLLEQQVVPEFYNRDKNGIPVAWIERIRKSMSQLTPRFSANRSVREYTEKYYLPLATTYLERAAENAKTGKQIVEKLHALQQSWSGLRFGNVNVETDGMRHIFEVEVYLNTIDPNTVLVELYAEGMNGGTPDRHELKLVRQLKETNVYRTTVPATRPAADFTPRIIPALSGVSIPLEAAAILWQR